MRLDAYQTFVAASHVLLASVVLLAALPGSAFELPVLVPVLLVGVVLRNVLTRLTPYEFFDRALSVVGNVSLALFPAVALFDLRLWELPEPAHPSSLLSACRPRCSPAGWPG